MTPTITPLNRKRAFAIIFVTVLVDSIGFGIIIPVLPQLIMTLTGVTVDRAAGYGGWLSFVYALCSSSARRCSAT